MFHSDDDDVDAVHTDSEATQTSSDSDDSQSSSDSTASRRRAKQRPLQNHTPKPPKPLRHGMAWEHPPLPLEPGMLESEQGQHAHYNQDTMNSSPTHRHNAMMSAVAAAAAAAVAASFSVPPSGSFANDGSPGPGHFSLGSSPIQARHHQPPSMSPNRATSSGSLLGMDHYMDDDPSGMHSSSAFASAIAENGHDSDEFVSAFGGPDRPGPFELLARSANTNGDSPNPGARVAAESHSSSTSDGAALAHAASLALAAFNDSLPNAKSAAAAAAAAAAAESMTAPLPIPPPPPPPKMPAFLAAQTILAMDVPSLSTLTPAPSRLPLDASTTSVASASAPEASTMVATMAIARAGLNDDLQLSASPATSLGIIHEGSESQSQSQDSVASAGSGPGGESLDESQ
jgi:hypothetical protein